MIDDQELDVSPLTVHELAGVHVSRSTGELHGLPDVELVTAPWMDRFDDQRLHTAVGTTPPQEHETGYYALNTSPTGAWRPRAKPPPVPERLPRPSLRGAALTGLEARPIQESPRQVGGVPQEEGVGHPGRPEAEENHLGPAARDPDRSVQLKADPLVHRRRSTAFIRGTYRYKTLSNWPEAP
jgi:hypothetical protein